MSLTDLSTIVGGVLAALALAASARNMFNRTLGRRHLSYQRLARLDVQAQLKFFEAVLGDPPKVRRRLDGYRLDDNELIECWFVDRDYVVQTVSDDDDETVWAYSVTSRRRRFCPKFEVPPRVGLRERLSWWREFGVWRTPMLRVRPSRTRFAQIDGYQDEVRGWVRAGMRCLWRDFNETSLGLALSARKPDRANTSSRSEERPPRIRDLKINAGAAHWWAYSETYDFGRAGGARAYVLTASEAAEAAPVGNPLVVADELGASAFRWNWQLADRWPSLRRTQEFRRNNAVTTWSVIHSSLGDFDDLPIDYGPGGPIQL